MGWEVPTEEIDSAPQARLCSHILTQGVAVFWDGSILDGRAVLVQDGQVGAGGSAFHGVREVATPE